MYCCIRLRLFPYPRGQFAIIHLNLPDKSFLLFQTKGLTLEQVDQMMEETTPRTSAKWRPHSEFSFLHDTFILLTALFQLLSPSRMQAVLTSKGLRRVTTRGCKSRWFSLVSLGTCGANIMYRTYHAFAVRLLLLGLLCVAPSFCLFCLFRFVVPALGCEGLHKPCEGNPASRT